MSLFTLLLSPSVHASPASSQEDLAAWWLAAGQIHLGETVYRVGDAPVELADGVCRVALEDGVLIPVFSGQAPVSERMVGLVWMGEGALDVDFVSRGDALRTAGHLARSGAAETAEVAELLAGQPLHQGIDRGLLLTADAEVLGLLAGLEPVGAGAIIAPGEDGADEVYVINDGRGRLRMRAMAVTVLEDRLNELERSGLDPRVMLRQDRLLHDELGEPGPRLRTVADFRTDRALHVAALEGSIGNDAYDRWLTCYRDGQDLAGTGYQAMAFAHGTDSEQRRHFLKLSGVPAPAAGTPERPAFVPVSADVNVTLEPQRRGIEEEGVVQSSLTLRAEGAPLQHLTLRMPTGDALLGSWQITALTDADGEPIPWVGLAAGLHTGPGRSLLVQAPASEQTIGAGTSATLASGGVTIPGSATASGGESTPAGGAESALGSNAEALALSEQVAFNQTPYRYEVLALLPAPVPEGESITVSLTWTARYRAANFSVSERRLALNADTDVEDKVDRSFYRSLGTTTGAQPLLPTVLPTAPAPWQLTATVGHPQPLLASRAAVISGQTQRRWIDEDTGWHWQTSAGEVRSPAVALGRWVVHEEPAASGMPAVTVALFPRRARDIDQFPAEVRRQVSFLDRILPDFPRSEVTVFQEASALPLDAHQRPYRPTLDGLIGLQMVVSETVSSGGSLREAEPDLARVQLARQVAGQHWGQAIAPASAADAWMMDALAGVYAALYIETAAGEEAGRAHLAAMRQRLESSEERSAGRGASTPYKRTDLVRPVGLTTPTLSDIPPAIRADYGTYVLVGMLRPRLTEPVFLAALDRFAAEHAGQAVSTAQLQTAFEHAAGRDLSDFFDYWVQGGLMPALTLTWSPHPDGPRGCLESDVSLGSIDAIVEVTDDNGTIDALVTLVDGQARLVVAPRQGAVQVALDPDGLTLARSRQVHQVKDLHCWTEPLSAAE